MTELNFLGIDRKQISYRLRLKLYREKCFINPAVIKCTTRALRNCTFVNSLVLVMNLLPQNLSASVGTPFSRGSGIITKSEVQTAPDSATKSVHVEAI